MGGELVRLVLYLRVGLIGEANDCEDLAPWIRAGCPYMDLVRRRFIYNAHECFYLRSRLELNPQKTLLDLALDHLLDEEILLAVLSE